MLLFFFKLVCVYINVCNMCVLFIYIYTCTIDSISNPHSITSFPGHRAAQVSLAQLADAYAISSHHDACGWSAKLGRKSSLER